uniref:Bm8826 n=1 Tax=Brugia malayi TaxID=6279 RepID=A0A1I9GE98_BRUMA|nr:Bm8826 [Brugia malayi]
MDRVAEWLRRWTANPLGFPRFTTKSVTYADKNEGAITVLWITTIIIYLLLVQAAYLINKNLYTWSAVMQAKHLKMLRDREYVLLRTYNRELQFSRLMQGIMEDEDIGDTNETTTVE